tara:strand:- start:212 stop:583 length:372 start_codon:yes stop_codon:yes gene_type:complete
MNKSREKQYLSKSSIGTRQTLSLFRSSSFEKKRKKKFVAPEDFVSPKRNRKEGKKRSIKIERDATLCKEATTRCRRSYCDLNDKEREKERKREIGKRKKNIPCRRSPLVGTFYQFPLRHKRCT